MTDSQVPDQNGLGARLGCPGAACSGQLEPHQGTHATLDVAEQLGVIGDAAPELHGLLAAAAGRHVEHHGRLTGPTGEHVPEHAERPDDLVHGRTPEAHVERLPGAGLERRRGLLGGRGLASLRLLGPGRLVIRTIGDDIGCR